MMLNRCGHRLDPRTRPDRPISFTVNRLIGNSRRLMRAGSGIYSIEKPATKRERSATIESRHAGRVPDTRCQRERGRTTAPVAAVIGRTRRAQLCGLNDGRNWRPRWWVLEQNRNSIAPEGTEYAGFPGLAGQGLHRKRHSSLLLTETARPPSFYFNTQHFA